MKFIRPRGDQGMSDMDAKALGILIVFVIGMGLFISCSGAVPPGHPEPTKPRSTHSMSSGHPSRFL